MHVVVIVRVDDHRDAVVIFRCRTNHRRAADVDVLDRIVDGCIRARDRCFERIQVDDQQVDRFDAVFVHDRLVGAATTEQSAMDGRMQGLDAAVHDLRKAGFLGDFADVEAGLAQLPAGAAGGNELDARRGEAFCKRNETALVRNADQRATYLEHQSPGSEKKERVK